MPSKPRPRSARLFNAASQVCQEMLGDDPVSITIRTRDGRKFRVDPPAGWEAEDGEEGRIAAPECFAEVLYAIVQAGKRLTRAGILTELSKAGRDRAESTVGEALQQLTKLGILDNRQDVSPKGYGLPSWSD